MAMTSPELINGIVNGSEWISRLYGDNIFIPDLNLTTYSLGTA